MTRYKKEFIAYLKRVYKNDPGVKELRTELKNRHMEFYTRDDGKKTIVFVQAPGWRKGKSPRGREWSNWFEECNEKDEDCRETLLVWTELLGTDPLGGIGFINDFAADEDDEETEEVSYIQ